MAKAAEKARFLKRFRPTIAIKVSMLAAGIAAMASVLVGSIIMTDAVEIIYEEELKYLHFVAHAKADTLVTKVDSLSRDTRYLAGTPPVTGIPRARAHDGIDPLDGSTIERWKDRLATIFTELIRAKPFYLQVRYIDATSEGRELVRVDRLAGNIKTRTADELQNKGHTDYFQQAIRVDEGDIYLSDINLNRENNRISTPYTPVLRAATPIYFEDRLFGIIVINMDLSDLFDEIIRHTPQGTTAYVTNEQGDFLAHPDPSRTFGFDLGKRYRLQLLNPQLGLEDGLDNYDDEFSRTMRPGSLQVVKAYFDPMNPGRYMAIVLMSEHDNIYSRTNEIRELGMLVTIALALISMLLAALLARRLLRPLRLIVRASEDLVEGRTMDYLPVEKNDEIGELARSFDSMHRQLEDKNREIMESQARSLHVNKLAALGEMASGIAHEINTPIQTVNLIAERIKRKNDQLSYAEIGEQMDRVSASIDKVSRIIESLRKVSRNSKYDDFDQVVLGEILDDALDISLQRFQIANIDLQVEFTGVSASDTVECKRIQIAQILINLLNNAYDALSPLEHGWLRLEVADAGGSIRFSFTDSGPAIDPAVRERLFEPLFTTKDIGKGTGLGLSISREIARNHQGELYFDDTSVNNRFVLVIPRRQTRADR